MHSQCPLWVISGHFAAQASRLRHAACSPKQQGERRQAAEPCAGRKQMHHIGDEVEVSGRSRRGPGVTDQGWQGDQGDGCGKLKVLRRRPEYQQTKQERERQPHAPNQSEACLEQHRPGAPV